MLVALYFCASYSRPVLFNYSKKITVYTDSASSTANFFTANANDYFSLKKPTGESCVFHGVSLDELLETFSAEVFYTETVGETTCYYGYSKKLPYSIIFNGKKTNVHIAVSDGKVVFGTPIIFGSY